MCRSLSETCASKDSHHAQCDERWPERVMHVARVRLERHTLAKISPSWSLAVTRESNCRMWKHVQESQSRVENRSICVTPSSTQNSCNCTEMRNHTTTAVQN